MYRAEDGVEKEAAHWGRDHLSMIFILPVLIQGLLHSRNEASQVEIFEYLYFPMPCAVCQGHESEQNRNNLN